MKQPSAPAPEPVVSRETAIAFLTGCGIGIVVWLIADAQRGNMASFTMAVVLLASASAAAVSYMLSRGGATVPTARRGAEIHRWLGTIAGGVLAAIQGLNAF